MPLPSSFLPYASAPRPTTNGPAFTSPASLVSSLETIRTILRTAAHNLEGHLDLVASTTITSKLNLTAATSFVVEEHITSRIGLERVDNSPALDLRTHCSIVQAIVD